MKKTLVAIVIALLFTLGCGASQKGNTTSPASTSLAGNWTITASSQQGSSVFIATLVSSPCNVASPLGTFTVTGPACFIANNNTGQGSVTEGSGVFFYPPQGVLIGTAVNPAPAGASVNLVFVEADEYGDAAVIDASGSVAKGQLSGTWTCDASSLVCQGDSGTFTATQ